jgi:DNA-binding CsgD family transcriptional regulator
MPAGTAAVFVASSVSPRPKPLETVATLFSLTRQEAVVLSRTIMGETNEEIGNVLDLAVPTVRAHLRQVFTKMRVTRRSELAPLVASFEVPVHASSQHLLPT